MQDQTLLALITEVQQAMGRLFNQRAAHFGLTRPQWRVLVGLHGSEGITQTELAEIVGIARSPLGKMVDKLEAAGWIVRRADAADRRVNRLYLTDAYEPLMAPSRKISKELEDDVLKNVDARTRDQLYATLVEIRSSMKQLQDAQTTD
jgi:DNA-binding MarR family transcriptional regulator